MNRTPTEQIAASLVTAERIQYWLDSINDYGCGDGKYWIPTTEAFKALCELAMRQCGPKTPPRYSLSVYQDADYEFTADELGDWVKWEDIASLFATGTPQGEKNG